MHRSIARHRTAQPKSFTNTRTQIPPTCRGSVCQTRAVLGQWHFASSPSSSPELHHNLHHQQRRSSSRKDVQYGSRTAVVSYSTQPPSSAPSVSLAGFGELEVPEIDGDIRSLQVELGATFDAHGNATTFGRKREALLALFGPATSNTGSSNTTTGSSSEGPAEASADTGTGSSGGSSGSSGGSSSGSSGTGSSSGCVVLHVCSGWGRLRVGGGGARELLQGQSTADLRGRQPGEGADTVFVSPRGRCLALATCLLQRASALLLTEGGAGELAGRLRERVFPGDDVTIQDLSSRTVQLALLGPGAGQLLRELAPGDTLAPLLSARSGSWSHCLVGFRGRPLLLAAGSGLGPGVPGYMAVAEEEVAGELYGMLAGKGAIPMGTEDWEAARILAGRPTRGSELTEAYNPLEAGLYGAVSLNKGCYIGQETLAKLHLREGVNRQLWGLRLSGPAAPGEEITSELSKVGVVTSVCQDAEGEWVGLGYLRCRVEGTQLGLEGVRVAVGGAPATVTAIPFATRSFSQASEALEAAKRAAAAAAAAAGDMEAEVEGGDSSLAARLEEAKRKKAEAQAEKLAATEAKLKAMQERVAAWQAAQQQQ